MNPATQRSKRTIIGTMAALIMVSLLLQGCIIFLSSVATVVMMKGEDHHTTTVLVKKSPAEVYAAMTRIIAQRPEIEVKRQDDESYLIEAAASRGNVTAKATAHSSDVTQLIVTSDSQTDLSDADLALNVVKQICDELAIDYKVVES
jgi:hypothetical protein